MTIAIVGSRSFSDAALLKRQVLRAFPGITCIISGGAAGADSLARELAVALKLSYYEVLPDWKTYGRAAGPVRNKEIIDRADAVIAMWDGRSRGTASAIRLAENAGKRVVVVRFDRDVCSG